MGLWQIGIWQCRKKKEEDPMQKIGSSFFVCQVWTSLTGWNPVAGTRSHHWWYTLQWTSCRCPRQGYGVGWLLLPRARAYIRETFVLLVLLTFVTGWYRVVCGCIFVFEENYRTCYWRYWTCTCTFSSFCAEMRHIEKSQRDFSICLMVIFSNGADFLKNLVDFFSWGVDFLEQKHVR